ncbi:unnamed protein product [Symbiodinium microadriaticum]|nr:unnamed protein product [Symbiodinium microadriaticum]CAE7949047.1 unnamed protein product [Symbiodinium sp. KB8]
MEVVNPEVMRVTPVFRALEQFARALRAESAGDFYFKSRQTERISTFWSHSWHGGHWKKILAIITFYNGTAAVALALLTGVLVMVLFCFGTLPGIDRGWYFSLQWSCWSTCSGFVVASLAMIFWRPQTGIFLDRICISQNNERLKTDAILSLAGLLKHSDNMLILWDPTWTQRLWCLFELAAFLKSKKKTSGQHLIVRPIFMGPLSTLAFLTFFAMAVPITTAPVNNIRSVVTLMGAIASAFCAVAFPTASTIRSYFRDLDTMKLQLLSISVDSTRSSCCDQKHVTRSGGPMICDRKIVKECLKIWFGSESSFEDTVRTEVLDILNRDLTEKVFSTPWALGVTSPLILAFMDVSASWTRVNNEWKEEMWSHPAIALLLEGLVLWLLFVPPTKDLLILLLRLARRRPRSTCLELLKNAMVLGTAAVPVLLVIVAYAITRFADLVVFDTENATLRAVSFGCCTLLIALCNFLLQLGLKALLQRPGW